jgi:hypothetical protein
LIENLQAPMRSTTKGVVSPLPAGVTLPPLKKAYVIEFNTELLRQELTLHDEKVFSTETAQRRLLKPVPPTGRPARQRSVPQGRQPRRSPPAGSS